MEEKDSNNDFTFAIEGKEYTISEKNDISKNNKDFTFVDLIKFPISNLNDLYLKCDGHWTPKGNKWAAEIISKYLK